MCRIFKNYTAENTIIKTKKLESKNYSDQIGRFTVKSKQGNQYIFILYHYDTSTINAVSIKSRYAKCITDAWQLIFNIIKTQGLSPNIHILDNKYSYHLKEAFKAENVKYQLVTSHIHRRNTAECAIRTYKNCLITGLCLCDTKFPLKNGIAYFHSIL